MRMELTGEKWYNRDMVFDDFHRGEAILPPEEEAKLRAELEAALAENTSLKTENDALREQLAALKKAVYGQRSEKSEYVLEGGEQLSLFNEAECEENRREREREEPIVVAPHTRKKKRTHDEMAANLPMEEVIHPAGASEYLTGYLRDAALHPHEHVRGNFENNHSSGVFRKNLFTGNCGGCGRSVFLKEKIFPDSRHAPAACLFIGKLARAKQVLKAIEFYYLAIALTHEMI